MRTILGIDPGSTTIGYGVINCPIQKDKMTSMKLKPVEFGYIDLKSPSDIGGRLAQLYKDISFIFKKYKPDSLAIESVFFFQNAKTFTPVIQSKGVILLAAAQANVKAFEYTPLQVKQAVSGNGKASKDMVQKMVTNILNIKTSIRPDDVSDALAIALCHFYHLTGS